MIYSLYVQQHTLLLCHWFSLKRCFLASVALKWLSPDLICIQCSRVYTSVKMCRNITQSCSPVTAAVGTGWRSEPELQDWKLPEETAWMEQIWIKFEDKGTSRSRLYPSTLWSSVWTRQQQQLMLDCKVLSVNVQTTCAPEAHSFAASLALSLWMSLGHSQLSCNALTLICSQIRFTASPRV